MRPLKLKGIINYSALPTDRFELFQTFEPYAIHNSFILFLFLHIDIYERIFHLLKKKKKTAEISNHILLLIK